MAYVVTNLLPGDLSMSGLSMSRGGKANVEFISKALEKARARGAVSISPDNGASAEARIVSAAGTPSVSYTLVDVGASFDQSKLNANFATVAAEITRLARIGANSAARLSDLPVYQN